MEENKRAFTTEEQQQIEEIAKSLDLSRVQTSVQFGAGVQRRLSDLSDRLLRRMESNTSLNESAKLIDELLHLIEEISAFEEPKGFFAGLFGGRERYLKRFEDADLAIDSLASEMDIMRLGLLKDNVIMEEMYKENLLRLKMLEIYIEAGEKALAEAQAKLAVTQKTGNIIEDSRLSNLEAGIRSFEKRLHDLKLSRTIALQTAPQIALLQENNRRIGERLQMIIYQTVPLWRNQVALAAGLDKQNAVLNRTRLAGQKSIEETKKLSQDIKQAAQRLSDIKKQGGAEAQAIERANEELKQTVLKAQAIQQAGEQQRLDAEKELSKLSMQISQLNGPIKDSTHRELLKPLKED
ncbi:MAG: toxic anion resistance protein [Eubacteriales bacterium]|nr:toxic anion resistance protein [Eubacteriales bacterium]